MLWPWAAVRGRSLADPAQTSVGIRHYGSQGLLDLVCNRRSHCAHSARLCRLRKLRLSDLQGILGLHLFRDVEYHTERMLPNRRCAIGNAKNMKLYPDELAILSLQLFDQLKMTALALS